MRTIRLLDLGGVSAIRSQTAYHAAARAMGPDSPDTIILVWPRQPYVCIGFHQDPELEVDLDFCRRQGLLVIRREVGGGAVYLDRNQVFCQWVFREGHLPPQLERQFALFVEPLVETYRGLGIRAELRPVNDVHVEGKKIGGTGAAQIGSARVLVGSLMFDFDKRTMARVLRVASEKMRDKVFASLEEYMTTIREQVSGVPPRATVLRAYVDACSRTLGAELVPGAWRPDEEAMAADLDLAFTGSDWLHRVRGRATGGVKIHEGVRVVEGAFKAPGGLVRVTATVRDGLIDDVTFTGDFTMLPSSGPSELEGAVRGVPMELELLEDRLREAFRAHGIQAPGLEPADLAQAVLAATG